MGCVLAAVLLIAFEGMRRDGSGAKPGKLLGCGRNDSAIDPTSATIKTN
jgi:hypothetical protein